MPTRAGWQLLIFSLAAFVAGRALRPLELYVLGATAAAAVITALGLRVLRPSRLEVQRNVSAELLEVGSQTQVTLHIANQSARRSPLVVVYDRISEPRTGRRHHIRLHLASLPGRPSYKRGRRAADSRVKARYRLSSDHRGVVNVGPVRFEDHDALGLARRRHRVDLHTRVIFHPSIEPLAAMPVSNDDDPERGDSRQRALGRNPEDFDGLRSYVNGDDPRRIHWPSTARLDELMVRQFHPPRRGRLIMIIDTRPPGDLAAAQDCTTSVAASVAAAVLGAGDEVQIATTDGRATPVLTRPFEIQTALAFCAVLSGGNDHITPGLLGESSVSGRSSFSPTLSDLPGLSKIFAIPDISDTAAVMRKGSVAVVVTASPKVATSEKSRRGLAQLLHTSLVISCDVDRWGAPEALADAGASSGWIHLTAAGQLSNLLQSIRWTRDVRPAAGVSG